MIEFRLLVSHGFDDRLSFDFIQYRVFVLIPITNLAACTNSSVFFSLSPANTISILEKKYIFLMFDLAYQLFMCFFTTLDVVGSGQLQK